MILSVVFFSLLKVLNNIVEVRIIIKIINKSPTVIPLSLKFISNNHIYFNITFFIKKIINFSNFNQKNILRKYKKNIKKLRPMVIKTYKNSSLNIFNGLQENY